MQLKKSDKKKDDLEGWRDIRPLFIPEIFEVSKETLKEWKKPNSWERVKRLKRFQEKENREK